jgi:hypothetical protein
MKKTLTLIALTLASPAMARDTVLKLPLTEVLKMPEAQDKLDGSVRFYLAEAKTPKVLEKKDEGVFHKKTNIMEESDEVGCKRAALSALLALQEAAKKKGANAVVGIVSYYKKNEFKSATEYECHAGTWVIGVTLKGTYARVAR